MACSGDSASVSSQQRPKNKVIQFFMPTSSSTNPNSSARVCAVIITFNRREVLRQCLASLRAQTRPVDQILVINNASSDGTHEMLDADPDLVALHLGENGGPSRGFYEGFNWVRDHGFDFAWAVDDEGWAEPDCLQSLLEPAHPNAVVVPMKQDSQNRVYGIHIWKGRDLDIALEMQGQDEAQQQVIRRDDLIFDITSTLLGRGVLEKIGPYKRNFFIWFDDFEYALRAKEHPEIEVLAVPRVLFHHDWGINTRQVHFLGRTSLRSDQPAWKLYYGARNPFYTLIRRGHPQEIALFLLVQTRLLLMDIVFEADRWLRVRLRLKGFADGFAGRLGKRVLPGSGRNR